MTQPASGAVLDEIAGHAGITRLNRDENDASVHRRLEYELERRRRLGFPSPVAAGELTIVQEAIKQTILDMTALRDDVPLEEIILALGTPSVEIEQAIPAIVPMVMPILRRMSLDGEIVVREDDRPRGRRPRGQPDPFEGIRYLVSRARVAPVAPRTDDRIDLLHDPTTNTAYVRFARMSYDRIQAALAGAVIQRVVVPGEDIALDYDPEGGLVGMLVQNADDRFTSDTLETATVITV